jgi:hypothetical protein
MMLIMFLVTILHHWFVFALFFFFVDILQSIIVQKTTLFLAGEPVDAPSSQWIGKALGESTDIVDNYWQTEVIF